MGRRRGSTTKLEIIQVAADFFLGKGYSVTSPKMIADVLGISTGNITYYFPSKEYLLAVMTEMLCDFHWKMMEQEVDDGNSSVMALCLELMTTAAACQMDPIVKELFLSTYTRSVPLEILRRHDTQRSKQVFAQYCPDWTHEKYVEAETLVSGIEFGTLMTTGDSAPLDIRIAGALDCILNIYQVPQPIRQEKIRRVLQMDYMQIADCVIREFKAYVKKTTANNLEEVPGRSQRKSADTQPVMETLP